MSAGDWPALPLTEWADTCATLQLWTQIVGKIRLARTPLVNHWWNVTLYVTSRGLTTSPIPHGALSFQINFDFISHRLIVQVSNGDTATIPLTPRSVAGFHAEFMSTLRELGLDTHIWTMPVEIPDAVPFEKDDKHTSYDPEYANRFWRALVQSERVFSRFRSRFIGKVSPVHFFWGSFDLAVTRFSGRTAPDLNSESPNLGAWVMREAYSHEVSSCGFWPGNGGYDQAAFYSYAYPEPPAFDHASVRPAGAFYDQGLGQFILPYDAVRLAEDPDHALMEFLQSTYEAAAGLAAWDRSGLERATASP
jgi:Family of unknown function (DUF5996)